MARYLKTVDEILPSEFDRGFSLNNSIENVDLSVCLLIHTKSTPFCDTPSSTFRIIGTNHLPCTCGLFDLRIKLRPPKPTDWDNGSKDERSSNQNYWKCHNTSDESG